MRSSRANNQVEAGFIWATANDHVWAMMMPPGGNALRLYTPVAGTCLEVSPTTGEVSIPGRLTARSSPQDVGWGSVQVEAAPIGTGSAAYVRSVRAGNQAEAGFLWGTVNDQHLNRWAMRMPVSSNNLQLLTPDVGVCFEVSSTNGVTTFRREVNVDADLRMRGRAVANPPWIAGHFDCGPPVANVNVTGLCVWTVTRSSLGVFVVAFGEPHPRGDSYTVIATIPSGGFVQWSKATMSLTLSTYAMNGQPMDVAEVNFMTIP